MGFSNVPGSRDDWYVTGKRVICYGFPMAVGKTVSMGWGAISHVNNIKVSFLADQAAIKDADWLVEQFERNLDNFLGNKEWRKFDPAKR
jgi:hypothetical protein